ncbi:hypothetical protein BE20_00725 [Sorangium cellulosum]|nr:hypothetical protein BE20_00725 [Sorangium cellulosum]
MHAYWRSPVLPCGIVYSRPLMLFQPAWSGWTIVSPVSGFEPERGTVDSTMKGSFGGWWSPRMSSQVLLNAPSSSGAPSSVA